MALHVYVDDSGGKGQGHWMAMSGLFGEAQVMAAVATEWQSALDAYYPGLPLEYFKMDEACGFKGQFAFWSPQNRDARVLSLAKVIDRPDLLDISGRLDLEAHGRIGQRWSHIKSRKGDAQRYHAMAEPYVLLAIYIISSAVSEAVNRGATNEIEIVFDEHSRFAPTIINAHMDFRLTETDQQRLAVMPMQPVFRNDDKFVVLQAADMLADETRLTAEAYPDNPDFIGKLCPRLSATRLFADMNEQQLELLRDHVLNKN